jgi:7,8-dihydropterin-6-yl-methyl-4-(beta-D-ribofuranosyl)aminobenzene 5'-phosphate synthase
MIKIEILLLANNCVLPFQNLALEYGLNFIELNKLFATQSLAEHGLGFIVNVYDIDENEDSTNGELLYKMIFDTGSTNKTFIHNLDVRALSLYDVNSIVLSHWHYDHMGGLYDILERIEKKIPIITHKFAQYERFFRRSKDVKPSDLANKTREDILPLLSAAKIVNQAPLDMDKINGLNGEVIFSDDSDELYKNDDFLITVSGEIPRAHPEEDFHDYFSLQGDRLRQDKILDDKCLIIENADHVVLLNGCCHSGLMNTIDYAKELTHDKPISHIIGGFHMASAGPVRVAKTIDYLRNLEKFENKLYLFPIHCTGQKFLDEIKKANIADIEAFDTSVGTLFSFYF